MTIDELAARTGTTVRNIRYYTEQGLVPPPTRRGRMAYYGAEQRTRLELVRHLHDHGYTLSAIGKVLQRIPADATADDVAIRVSLLAPWADTDADTVERGDLERRAGQSLTDTDVEALIAMGAARRLPDGTFHIASHLLDTAAQILALNVSPRVFEHIATTLDRHVTALARDLMEVEELLPGRTRAESLAQIASVLPRLRPLVMDALIGRFTSAIDAALHEWADSLNDPTGDPRPDATAVPVSEDD